MKYEKPEVNAVLSASKSIKGGKAVDTPHDGIDTPNVKKTTTLAYECDE
jgi:hypothetical protein